MVRPHFPIPFPHFHHFNPNPPHFSPFSVVSSLFLGLPLKGNSYYQILWSKDVREYRDQTARLTPEKGRDLAFPLITHVYVPTSLDTCRIQASGFTRPCGTRLRRSL